MLRAGGGGGGGLILPIKRALYTLTASQIIPTGAGLTPVAWDRTLSDPRSYDPYLLMDPVDNTLFTNDPPNDYSFMAAYMIWQANAVGIRVVKAIANGVQQPGLPADSRNPPATGQCFQNIHGAPAPDIGSDQHWISVAQTSGGNLNLLAGSWVYFECRPSITS